MFERYTAAARKTIFFARYEASQFGNAEIGIEHLLLGILREDLALAIRLLGTAEKAHAVRRQVEERIPRGGEKLATSVDLPLNQDAKRALDYAGAAADRFGHRHIGTEHLLAGLLQEERTLAAQIAAEHGLTLSIVTAEAQKAVPPPPDIPPLPKPLLRRFGADAASKREALLEEQPVRDLTDLAAKGMVGPLIGREREMEHVIRILSRRTRKNAVLIGEPGVGKTAIAEGLAQLIMKKAVPAALSGRTVLAIDAVHLIAPKAPRLAGHPGAILFIHGLFDIATAGYSWAVLEAIHILEPLLVRSGMQCVATGTPAGYKKTVAKAALLALHFEIVPVLPPRESEAIEILHGVKHLYEDHHDVKIGEEAIATAVAASAQFLRHRFLPDRALDLLDEAAAKVSLRCSAAAMTGDSPSNNVTPRDIAEVAAGFVGAPLDVVEKIMAQPDANRVEKIAHELVGMVPEGRLWLESLAAYLAGCTDEEAAKLAAVIRARGEEHAQK
jgi:ATP-dependent Clp protease ATP-binding subunit ClpC